MFRCSNTCRPNAGNVGRFIAQLNPCQLLALGGYTDLMVTRSPSWISDLAARTRSFVRLFYELQVRTVSGSTVRSERTSVPSSSFSPQTPHAE